MKPLNKEWIEYYTKQYNYCVSVYKEYDVWVCAWRLMKYFQNTEVVEEYKADSRRPE